MRHNFTIGWFFVICLINLAFPILPAHASDSRAESISVSASIGQYHLIIFGYTSPNSKVELTSPGVYDQTYSDADGYYNLDSILPDEPPSLCLISHDPQGRSSSPLCTPAPPIDKSINVLGPIYLPPTITITQDPLTKTYQLTGQSVPNTPLEVVFFAQTPSPKIKLVKTAHAYSLPSLTLNIDPEGNYSAQLPPTSGQFRLLTQISLDTIPGPRSLPLNYAIPRPPDPNSIVPKLPYILLWVITLIILIILLLQKSHPRYLPYLYQKQIIILPQKSPKP